MGDANLNWTGGSDVVGANAPVPDWYFAEGTCRPDFDPYICIQNPGDATADILITYMKGNGTTQAQTASVAAHSRSTIDVRSVLGTGNDAAHDFSVSVSCSNGSIICERPTFFNYQEKWNGGHDVMGATSSAGAFYFAEGSCRPGFDAYLSIQNQNSSAVDVTVTYLKGDGTTATQSIAVAANSRATLHPSDVLGTGNDSAHDFSATVRCGSGQQIIVERPMYFNYKPGTNNWTGGSDVVGYTP
jgi:histidinol-phosphate/aromatic aminotransferase/cobyric acid decarboxylase-like protein